MSRENTLAHLKTNPNVSVLIIGGGINGIGTFRDLALQGVDVMLVEKGDFISGASAASSHMVHGGIRYLENGEFRLVREALHERNRLLRNAPHLVHPLPTTIPIFEWFSGLFNAPLKFLGLRDKPSKRGAVVIKLGLMMYDWFARHQKVMPNHKLTGRAEALRIRPQLNPDILYTATYYDGWMPYPERIGVELLLDAEAANPNARALNYVEAVDAAGDEVTVKDVLTDETYTLKPRIVINAAGPWIDFANRALGIDTRFIGGTKGSHIILDNPDLHAATAGNEIFFENEDGRITLILPYKERVMLGTTDIRIDHPEEAVCTDEEIEYMFGMIDVVFPNITMDRSQIVFQISGVRPLPASDASRTGAISRDHSIRSVPAGNGLNFPIHALVGGKWTTFRAFSEQVTDKILADLGQARRNDTRNTPIGGGKDFPHDSQDAWLAKHAEKTGLSRERLATLFERYGTRALDVAYFILDGEDTALTTKPDYSQREIIYIARTEKVIRLDDFLLRRSLIAMLGYATKPVLEEVADVLKAALDWTDEQRDAEVLRAMDILTKKYGMQYE